MAFMDIRQGNLLGICRGGFDLGAPCTQKLFIDGLSVLFLVCFFLSLLVECVRRHSVSEQGRKDWVFVTCSVCCAITSIAYLGVSLWYILAANESSYLSWFAYVIRGLIWMTLSISLIIKKTKPMQILILVWWVGSALLACAFNLEVLVKKQTIQILDAVSWPVKILLLVCALHMFKYIVCRDNSYQDLSRPLLTGEGENSPSILGESNFLSQLTFSWLNPFLHTGYLKPLVLEDIPSLVAADKALVTYQSFLRTWDPVRENNSSNTSSNLILHALWKVHFKELIITGIYAFLRTISVVVSPLLLYAFVQYSSFDEENLSYGLLLVGCLAVVKITESLSQRHWFFNARRSGMRMRSALMVAIGE